MIGIRKKSSDKELDQGVTSSDNSNNDSAAAAATPSKKARATNNGGGGHGTATGIIKALNSGIKHLAVKRFTLRYPEEKLKFVGDGYQFDPTTGVGIAGLKGRHMLFHDHCTGCQLCSIACEGVAEAIGMVKVPEQWNQNKKSIMPQIDYGKCVFCGLCVDACPFYALYMSNDYELSSFTKEGLIYTPAQLQVKPNLSQDVEIKIDERGASHG